MQDKRTRVINFFAAPLNLVFAGALIVCSTGRLAFALVACGGLLFVYAVCIFVRVGLSKLCPKTLTRAFFVFLVGFADGLYLFIISFLNPMLASEVMLIVLFVAVGVGSSGLDRALSEAKNARSAVGTLGQALALSVLLVLISVFREALSRFSLSLPGGPGGIREFVFYGGTNAALSIMAGASGALFLTGFLVVLLRFLQAKAEKRAAKAHKQEGDAP
jgi:hypothetical protein